MAKLQCNQCHAPFVRNALSWLQCVACNTWHHRVCAGVANRIRNVSTWRCSECKICEVCQQEGDPATLLMCDFCDEAYHNGLGCLPQTIPEDSMPEKWKCPQCELRIPDDLPNITLPEPESSSVVLLPPFTPATSSTPSWSQKRADTPSDESDVIPDPPPTRRKTHIKLETLYDDESPKSSPSTRRTRARKDDVVVENVVEFKQSPTLESATGDAMDIVAAQAESPSIPTPPSRSRSRSNTKQLVEELDDLDDERGTGKRSKGKKRKPSKSAMRRVGTTAEPLVPPCFITPAQEIICLGEINPKYHGTRYIYPIGYTSRILWHSPTEYNQKEWYTNEIFEKKGQVMFRVRSDCGNYFSEAVSPTGAIAQLLVRVTKLKNRHGNNVDLKHSGPNWFSLYHPRVLDAIQKLPGVEQCEDYEVKELTDEAGRVMTKMVPGIVRPLLVPRALDMHESRTRGPPKPMQRTQREVRRLETSKEEHMVPIPEPPPVPENPTGCARTEVVRRLHFIEKLQERRWIQAAIPPSQIVLFQPLELSVATESTSDAAKFTEHRKLIKQRVSFGKSAIHGWGVFAKIPIAHNEIIVEYQGELIRQMLCDEREKRYQRAGKDCYMFRLTDDLIVDATDCGNWARLINHSCQPNCYSRQITVDGQEHIVIETLRNISAGEELTYDYQFPIEEVKVPCFCMANKCKGVMN